MQKKPLTRVLVWYSAWGHWLEFTVVGDDDNARKKPWNCNTGLLILLRIKSRDDATLFLTCHGFVMMTRAQLGPVLNGKGIGFTWVFEIKLSLKFYDSVIFRVLLNWNELNRGDCYSSFPGWIRLVIDNGFIKAFTEACHTHTLRTVNAFIAVPSENSMHARAIHSNTRLN